MNNSIAEQLKSAADFGGKIEKLVLAKGQCPTGDRLTPLMAYWSLAFEFHKAILNLITHQFFGAAFALVRPLIECAIRAHLVLFVSEGILKEITTDVYRTNFGSVGKEIDDAFATGNLFQTFLAGAKDALHGYTHVGMHQLGRRFVGNDLIPNYSDDEIEEVIRTSTSAIFMVNNIVAKQIGWEDEWRQNTELFDEWGKSR